ncbi:MAG TPA: type I phosphomannose isomerase catalytic subunit [Gemmataceae bacterium]|nr:type I phosphomannose isomerase catalytic subunit [Gemmataceae bacterium]
MLHAPIRFAPYLRPMVWGGRRLGEALGKPLPTTEAFGESWEISDHPSHQSRVADGAAAGRTLRDLMQHEPAALIGAPQPLSIFPWLVKFLDARDWLSVQVHPDDAAVRRLWPGEGGKTEAWFVLDAAPTGKVYAGLRLGVDESGLREALRQGSVADCLHSFRPRRGDCLFLPAGTVHAVGGGVLMAEVQQTSDATFRLFDWNRRDAEGRSRTLHIEEAMACINWDAGPVHPVRAEGYSEGGESVRQRLVSCAYFTLDYVREAREFPVGGSGMQVLIVVQGRGRLAHRLVRTGDTLLLPADMAPAECRPEPSLGLLLAGLP